MTVAFGWFQIYDQLRKDLFISVTHQQNISQGHDLITVSGSRGCKAAALLSMWSGLSGLNYLTSHISLVRSYLDIGVTIHLSKVSENKLVRLEFKFFAVI